MKKNKIQNLYELINIMSSGERRTFTVQMGKDRPSYYKLYQKLSSKKSIGQLNPSDFKDYSPSIITKLYDKILSEIHSKDAPNKDNIAVNSLIEKAEILERRGLYNQSKKLIQKAERLALEIEDFQALIKIKKFQRKIAVEKEDKQHIEKINRISEDLKTYQDRFNEEMDYENLYYPLFLQYRTGKHKNIKGIEKQNLNYLLFDKPLNPNASFHAKSYFYRANIFYFLNLREYNQANQFFLKLLDLWAQNSLMKELFPSLFMIDIANFLGNLHKLERYDDTFLDKLNLLENIKCQNYNQEAEKFQNVIYVKLLFHLNRGEIERCNQTIEFYDNNLKKYQQKMNKARITTICFNIFSFYWIQQKYSECKKWANKILASDKSNHRKDLQKTLEMLCLIIDYEQSHIHLESKVKTFYNKLSRTDPSDSFDNEVVSAIKRLINNKQRLHNDPKKQEQKNIRILSEMKAELKKMDKKPNGYDEVIYWIDNRGEE